MERSNPEPLTCTSVEVRYGSVRAVAGADLSVEAGEIVAILGRSGSGKTTLLRAIAGFERVTAGEIRIGGRLIESPAVSVPAHRRSVGLVFQEYALFPNKTVAGNIAYGLGRGSHGRVEELLRLGRLEGLGGRLPHELSGGQQQRVAVLRSLAPNPSVLLLDEPFSNLDAELRADMRDDVATILREAGTTTLLVTHDRADAMAVADRIAVIEDGRVIEVATPEALYWRPSFGAAAYGGDAQFIDGIATGATVETDLGRLALAYPLEGPCTVLVRPEWIAPQGIGEDATVLSRRFEGAIVRLRLRLPSGRELAATMASSAHAEAGAVVTVGVPGHVPGYLLGEGRSSQSVSEMNAPAQR